MYVEADISIIVCLSTFVACLECEHVQTRGRHTDCAEVK